MTPIVCIHEDRADCLIGVKLAILSLKNYSPEIQIIVNAPIAPSSFLNWLGTYPDIKQISYKSAGDVGWNIKPSLLLRLLNDTDQDLVWIDSDIIICSDIVSSISRQADDVMVAAEEPYFGQYQGGIIRTAAWGLSVGRSLPSTINTGLLRVTLRHRPVLEAWAKMLRHPTYARVQRMPGLDRPLHMLGDQEVLTALMGSKEFSHVPLKMLKRGREIAQCFGPAGFTPMERTRAFISGRPGLIHSMGRKPWQKSSTPPAIGPNLKSLRDYYEYLHSELTPYAAEARKYKHLLDEQSDWMSLSSKTARAISTTFGHSVIMQEMPLAVVDTAVRRARKVLGIARYGFPDEYRLTESPI